jgi:hypothetical protein
MIVDFQLLISITVSVNQLLPSPTGRGISPLSTPRLSRMAAAGLGSHDFTGIVLEKKKKFLLNGHWTLQVVDKSLWIRFVVSHSILRSQKN